VRVVAEELERFLDGTVTAIGQFPNITLVNDVSFRISHVDVVTLA
jgi:hypothetical protein